MSQEPDSLAWTRQAEAGLNHVRQVLISPQLLTKPQVLHGCLPHLQRAADCLRALEKELITNPQATQPLRATLETAVQRMRCELHQVQALLRQASHLYLGWVEGVPASPTYTNQGELAGGQVRTLVLDA